MPPSLFPLIHSPCIWKMSQHGDKYVNLSYIELIILEFLKKKEREEKIQSRSALEGWSRFFDFAINYRICERSARVPIWNRVKLRIVRTTWPFFSLLSFLLPFYRNLLSDVARFCINRVSGFYLSTSQSPNLSMAATCGVIFSSFTLCQL